MSRARTRIINAAIGVLVFGVLFLGVALAFAISYPQIARTLFVDAVSIHPSLAVAVGRIDATSDAIIRRAGEGWEYRFVGTYQRLIGEPPERDLPPRDVFPEEGCMQCHPFFRERPLFSVVYFSHDAHAAEGLRCERCHVASGPNRCMPPAMSGCGDCHQEITSGNSCNMCHPYGSLFHGAALAGDREIGMQCNTCHIPTALVDGAKEMGLSDFDESEDSCRACHEPVFCGGCHPSGHPAAYSFRHAVEMRAGEAIAIQCYECHSPAGCANCHSLRRR
ncbi:MAG: cytochrome c3 family protein [Actinobacteria bacterium]|nr:cytochrome c3 family protein [Actinomycetota bacterium]